MTRVWAPVGPWVAFRRFSGRESRCVCKTLYTHALAQPWSSSGEPCFSECTTCQLHRLLKLLFTYCVRVAHTPRFSHRCQRKSLDVFLHHSAPHPLRHVSPSWALGNRPQVLVGAQHALSPPQPQLSFNFRSSCIQMLHSAAVFIWKMLLCRYLPCCFSKSPLGHGTRVLPHFKKLTVGAHL